MGVRDTETQTRRDGQREGEWEGKKHHDSCHDVTWELLHVLIDMSHVGCKVGATMQAAEFCRTQR